MAQDPVLVTGAAGFIGFCLARRLLENGRAVVGVDSVNAYYDPVLKAARLAVLRQFRTLPSSDRSGRSRCRRNLVRSRQFRTGGAPRRAGRRAVLSAKSACLS